MIPSTVTERVQTPTVTAKVTFSYSHSLSPFLYTANKIINLNANNTKTHFLLLEPITILFYEGYVPSVFIENTSCARRQA